jgi:hypothetical protein
MQDAFAGSLHMEDSMEHQFVFPVRASQTYTVSVWVYVEPNYAGNEPRMIVRQAGATDVTVDATGARGVWEQISTTFTTGAVVDWLHVALQSRNTSALPNYDVYWQNVQVVL